MSRPWIRLYTDVPSNPKVQLLSPTLFKFWVNCLCLYGKKGTMPDVAYIAWITKMSIDAAQDKIDNLVEYGLFLQEDGVITPHDWDELQFESDTSRDRQRKYRERQAKRNGDVTVTVQDQNRPETDQRQTRAETERATPESPSPPESDYRTQFRSALLSKGFSEPDGNTEAEWTFEKMAETCEQSGAIPSLAAVIVSDLLKKPHCRGKPLNYLLGALRMELAPRGRNSSTLRKIGELYT